MNDKAMKKSPSFWQDVHQNTMEKNSKKYDDNLETFILIWLDPQVNKTDENQQLQTKLREIIYRFRTFDDQQQCKRYIVSLSPRDRIVFIVNGYCGRELVPQIHQLPQLSSIYIYCMNKQANEQWTKDFNKVGYILFFCLSLIFFLFGFR